MLFQTQRWSLQHGTTTAAYAGSFGVESVMELVDVVGKPLLLTIKSVAGICRPESACLDG